MVNMTSMQQGFIHVDDARFDLFVRQQRSYEALTLSTRVSSFLAKKTNLLHICS